MNPMTKRSFSPERTEEGFHAKSYKAAMVCLILILGFASTGYATVIGDFESSTDGWVPGWESPAAVLSLSTVGATRGSGSLSVVTNGGYWQLQWSAPTVPATLENKLLTFDLTMRVSDGPSGWTKIGDKIALNGSAGWHEYANAVTVVNKDTGEASSQDWGPWAGDITKTFTLDVSDYDMGGTGWFQIIMTIQGGDGVGHFYFDNFQIVDAVTVEPTPNPARLHVAGNRLKDPNGETVTLRGVSLIDLGFLQDWQGGALAMINRLTDEADDQGNSPGWYPNAVRIPVVPPDAVSGWPHQFDPNSNDFNDLLRTVVDYCGQKELYVIIDWHYVANTYDHNDSTTEFWTYVAPLFANDTHVMFELFNEPINDGDTELERWLSVREDIQRWFNLVRTYAPDTVILVGGPSYCQIIGPTAAYPVSGENIAYTSHIYPGHWLGGSRSWYVNHITTAVAAHPVIMTEWGFQEASGDALLQGTITNYGDQLKDFVENYGISMTAWVASTDWNPPMFDTDWSLLVGEGEMGGFAKDWIYEKNVAELVEDVNSEEDDVDFTIIDMTISSCTVKAGKTQRRDYFAAAGTFAAGVTDFDVNEIEVRIVGDANRIYTETIDIDDATISGNVLSYTGSTGAITSLTINLDANSFVIKARNIDLTGLACPVQLKFTLGSNRLSGQASEDVVNGTRTIIPTRLMRTYKDTLVVTSATDFNDPCSTKYWDNFRVKGEIAVEDVNDSRLDNQEVIITWGAQTYTVDAGSFTNTRGNVYKCKNAPASPNGLVNATIDLDKCKFDAKVRNVILDAASGDIDFGLSLIYGYNEATTLSMP